MKVTTLIGSSLCLATWLINLDRPTMKAQVPEGAQGEAGRGAKPGGAGLHGPAQKELNLRHASRLTGAFARPERERNCRARCEEQLQLRQANSCFRRSGQPEPRQIAGVTASPITQMIYVAARGRLAAVDLTTDKKVWESAYDGQCCERPQISPDGSFM